MRPSRSGPPAGGRAWTPLPAGLACCHCRTRALLPELVGCHGSGPGHCAISVLWPQLPPGPRMQPGQGVPSGAWSFGARSTLGTVPCTRPWRDWMDHSRLPHLARQLRRGTVDPNQEAPHTFVPLVALYSGSAPPPVRRPGCPSAHALGSRARPAPSLLLSTHSTTEEGTVGGERERRESPAGHVI